MKRKVNKKCFARIHKNSITKESLNSEILKNTKNLDSIEKMMECIDELNNLILNHKIQLQHIKNDSKMKDFKL
jgi:hypothetical protein